MCVIYIIIIPGPTHCLTGSYPIHLAAWKGDIEVARTLIERGPSQANVDAQSLCEETALHLAAQYGHREVRAD